MNTYFLRRGISTPLAVGILALALLGSAATIIFWPKQTGSNGKEGIPSAESSASALQNPASRPSPIPSGTGDDKKDWMNTHFDCDSETPDACVMCWTHMDTEEERCCFRSSAQIAAQDDFCTANDPNAKKRYTREE